MDEFLVHRERIAASQMRRLTFSAPARRDLDDIRSYIAGDSPASARDLVERLKAACVAPLDFPEVGKIGARRGTRELTTVWPYVIVYRVLADTISIERVIHGARLR